MVGSFGVRVPQYYPEFHFFPLEPRAARTLNLDRNRSREQARALVAELKKLSNAERTVVVDEVIAALGVSDPQRPPVEFAPLTWDEIRVLAKTNVEFGAHTRTHPILSSLAGREETLAEIGYSRDRIAAELDTPVLHFCYPNGRDDDIGEAAVQVTRECGFQTAVTTTPGTNRICHGARVVAAQAPRGTV